MLFIPGEVLDKRSNISRRGGTSYRERIEEKVVWGPSPQTILGDMRVCSYYSASGRVATLSLLYYLLLCRCVRVRYVPGKRKKYSWTREKGNEWAAGPFIPGSEQLAHFRTFFLYIFCPRPILVQREERSKKERKTLSDFSFFPIRHWRMAFHWKGAGWLAGLSVAIVICSSIRPLYGFHHYHVT